MGRKGYAIVGLIFVVLLMQIAIGAANWSFALTIIGIALLVIGIALLVFLLYQGYRQARRGTAGQYATIPPTASAAPSRMSVAAEENRALARRELEELYSHTGNIDAAEEIYAPDFVFHPPGSEDVRGVDAAKQFAASYRKAFPDLVTTVEDLLSEGDKTVARWTIRGTHQGEIEELGPPTGRYIEVTGISVYRVEGGKIAEYWGNYDVLGMMRQLGFIPAEPNEGAGPS
jgi:steroid delta-isomerase-like uncharacterized protein